MIQLPDTGFIRLPQVLQCIPVSRSTWLAGVASGRYPAGFLLSPRCRAWKIDDLRTLITNISTGEAPPITAQEGAR